MMIDFIRIDHVLISIPPVAKETARKFYKEVLQLKEIPGSHPRGAMWFEAGDAQLHIREEDNHNFNSDKHPAFEVSDLNATRHFLQAQNIAISYSSEIEGRQRCFFRDPRGNRFALIEFKASISN
ncbi:VOC family protein [Parafilimonas sp.]|uniref:VOC family protein n=1 Tax=Parafilimonas sp. TaxID=1969739 RepID=UPI0039E3344E